MPKTDFGVGVLTKVRKEVRNGNAINACTGTGSTGLHARAVAEATACQPHPKGVRAEGFNTQRVLAPS